jgi:hypothetical protein
MALPSILKYINIPAFIISLAIGILYVYTVAPDMRKITVYPTPDNVDIVQYKDSAGACFKYKQKDTKCPADSSKITQLKPSAPVSTSTST